MKRIGKMIVFLSFVFALIALVFYVIQLSRKHQLKDLVEGLVKSRQTGELVDMDGKGVRWVGRKSAENARAFEAKMAVMGYVPIGTYGRSHLYSRDGEEVLVKETTLMHQYVVFEIFNESYFQLQEVA